jgi:hypothetical protein
LKRRKELAKNQKEIIEANAFRYIPQINKQSKELSSNKSKSQRKTR